MSKRRVKTSRRSEQRWREIIMNKIKENLTGACRWFINQSPMLHFSLLPFLILVLIYVFGSCSFRVDIEIWGIDRYLLYLGFFLLFFYWLFWQTRLKIWFFKQTTLHISLISYFILIQIKVFGTYTFQDNLRFWGINGILFYLGFMLFFYWLFWETRITKNPAASGFIKFILTIFLLIFNLWLALMLL